jgi:mannose-6-phosphate isomerase-like protein (cupin superfamily)
MEILLATTRGGLVCQTGLMPFLDTTGLKIVERLPGWKGRFFHTATMTFADYEFTAGSTIHEHFHPEEEVYEVIAGELEMQVDGLTHVVRPGVVAIVPSNTRHWRPHRGGSAVQTAKVTPHRSPCRNRWPMRRARYRWSTGAGWPI